MNQPITGFHQDEERHWVADLACGHRQHVRHDPPWQDRPWVVTEEGRQSRLGVVLDCLDCDRAAHHDARLQGLCGDGAEEVSRSPRRDGR